MNRSLWIAAGGVVLIGATLFVSTQGLAENDRVVLLDMDLDVVSRGTTVYQENCASCHGINLEGQPNWRSRDEDGLLPAPPHDASGHTWHHDGETLFQLTKYGVGALINDPDYASNMPIYDGVLSDDEIIAVLSYIKSTWPDEIRARHDEMENRK
ncbi:c-type cytochrome [Yoonia sediminilitoris]|uniref:Cbb3-type cytochrome c oxidase subunit III n=1 Tax=Yoonia sediminilitoris TaxID=1286148 RepID=A0A2T6K0P7_9RHOB|nr:cbb3-type cytochrome c oxidase subunit III [Yoonia sediminilitoris]RCW89406.1 cbb3-type cytochrome c oxidase subunit III [Yoonia sediminilitoris]